MPASTRCGHHASMDLAPPPTQRRAGAGLARSTMVVLVALVVLAAIGSLGLTGGRPPGDPATAHAAAAWSRSACGNDEATPAPWKHVVWIWLENRAYGDVFAPGSDFAFLRTRVARDCASLDSMRALQHASLGNYIAAMTGSAAGVRGGCAPAACPIDRENLLGQVRAAGLEWRSYQEGLTRRCHGRDDGSYLVRHDPAPYLTREHDDCKRWDVPLGTLDTGPLAAALDTAELPAFAFVTPNACDGGHDCGDGRADAWLDRWLSRLTSSNAYARGDVAIVVSWDEGRRAAADVPINAPCPTVQLRDDCHIPTFVIAPGVPRGARIATPADHVTLLQLTEAMLDLPRLGQPRPEVRSLGRQLRVLA
ncbi:MAG: phosphoesterase [Thermoleophilia bacterium]|nr:phosphoesterase [Thermoleophilia bacterium]